MPSTIIIYATSWCWSSKRARGIFDKNNIPYEWVDIDENEDAAKKVMEVNHGYRSVPTIAFPDGTYLVEPSDSELKSRLNVE
jgi:glutaredoxin